MGCHGQTNGKKNEKKCCRGEGTEGVGWIGWKERSGSRSNKLKERKK